MPAPADRTIVDWRADYGAADTNSPIDSDIIGSFLDDQLRNLKSVARAESLNKSWERWLGVIPSFNFATGTTFTSPMDWTVSPATAGRRVRATLGTGYIYGRIVAASYSNPDTTVTVSWDSGALDGSLTEVAFGIEPTSSSSSSSGEITHGRAVMSNAQTEVAVSLTEADALYDIQLTLMRSTGAPLTGFGVKPGTLLSTGFTIEAVSSPGTGETFTFFYTVLR